MLSLLDPKTEILVIAMSMLKFGCYLSHAWIIEEVSLPKTRNAVGLFTVYDSLNDLVDETLCENPGNEFHKSECLHRSCGNCGTRKFQLLPEESTRTNSFATVKWQKFDYVETGEKRRLQLIEMQTSPGEMFDYSTKLLETFPAHRFRARWQHDQLQSLLDNLPLEHTLPAKKFTQF